jgi:hypothetical protein
MKRIIRCVLLSFGLLCLVRSSEAATYARSPKVVKNIGYTTVISTIASSAFVTGTSTPTIPGAVYGVYLGTGTAGDYCVLYDTNAASLLAVPTAGANGNLTAQLGQRLYFATTPTSVVFDPPMIFYAGLYSACINSIESAAVEFETGRGLSGN